MSDLTETKITGETVYSGRLLQVERDEVRLPNGKKSVREYIIHPGAVVVVPFLNNGNVILEKQFRYPPNCEFIECPAGKIDPGEKLEETGRRELLEETGYHCGELRYLGKLHPGIGYSNEIIYIYLAGRLRFEGRNMDQDEFLDVFDIPFNQALQMVYNGEITDAKTMVALLMAARKRGSAADPIMGERNE